MRRSLRIPSRSTRHPPGWSLVEMLVVVFVIGILTGITIHRFHQPPAVEVAESARYLSRAFDLTRQEASMRGRALSVEVDSDGRFRGSVESADSGEPWHRLPPAVRFGSGVVTHGPHGGGVFASVPAADVRCLPGGACEMDGSDRVVYYLESARDPTTVWAVSVSAVGSTAMHRFNAEEDAWR